MSWPKIYFLTHGRHYVNYSNESNIGTVDKIIVLMEEISILKSRYTEQDTGNLRTAVNVLENRVQELRDRVRD